MKTNKGDAENIIVSELLSYLAKHPQAQDTLEGITNWWLLEQCIIRQTADVQSALDELVSNGILNKYQGADDRIYYKVNKLR